MKVIRHSENLFRLVRIMPVNCFFVREDDGLTLVDANIPGRASQILQAAKTLQQPIRRILLTHAHGDHVGSLDALREQLPDAEVLIGARESRLLAQDFSLDASEPKSKLRGQFPAVKTRPTRLLNAGDRVGSLEAVFSPGHTPGHLSYFDTRDGALLTGDSFQTAGGVAVAGVTKLLFPLPAMFTWDRRLSWQSAKKMRELAPTCLAPGHGPIVASPLPSMDRAIAEAERGLKGSQN